MKKSKRIALCGMLSAMALVIMLLAYFPYMTFTLPALAGALFAIIMIEIGHKWAWGGYVTTAILSLLLCEKEAAMLFVGFFGYYPIMKAYLEHIRSLVLETILKFSLFNIAMVASYAIIIFVFGIEHFAVQHFLVERHRPVVVFNAGSFKPAFNFLNVSQGCRKGNYPH